jgi:hypothetical protein
MGNGGKKCCDSLQNCGSFLYYIYILSKKLKKTIFGICFSAGVGNHSRGQAALPTAVRSFLGENRWNIILILC